MIDVKEQLKKPDIIEAWRTIRWICAYNKWDFITFTIPHYIAPYGIVEGKYETNISINTGMGIVFRESYIGDSEDESQFGCVEYAFKRIFDYALFEMTRSMRKMKLKH